MIQSKSAIHPFCPFPFRKSLAAAFMMACFTLSLSTPVCVINCSYAFLRAGWTYLHWFPPPCQHWRTKYSPPDFPCRLTDTFPRHILPMEAISASNLCSFFIFSPLRG